MKRLRIVTINTGKGDGPYRDRIEWLKEQLSELAPAIVVFQESFACREDGVDTAHALAQRLGMQLAYMPARPKLREFGGRPVRTTSGMAMLALRPWTYVETIRLPRSSRDGERIAQLGVVEYGEGVVVVANIHLTHLRDADELRCRQLHAVLAHPLMRASGTVRLVCGDFNSVHDGRLVGSVLAGSSGLDVQDTWSLGYAFGPRGTLPGHGRESPCVDFIFSVANTGVEHPQFEATSIALDRHNPQSGIFPSDHFGIATTLLLGQERSPND